MARLTGALKDRIVFPDQEGAAIFSFPGTTAWALIMVEMQDQGFPVFCEFDDNYTVPPPFEALSMWRERRDHKEAVELGLPTYETASDIVRFVDGVIVSTPYLEGVYSTLNRNVHVCPNSVDEDDWPASPVHQQDGILRVGWAASDSHKYDAALIHDALAWASGVHNVEVIIMGIKPEVSGFRFPYKYVPWSDSLEEYRQSLQILDVMLCPIVESPWAAGKSDVKALEMAMSGGCSIVPEVEAYKPWFDQPAYVVKRPKDWKRILRYLVNHRSEVAETAALARRYAVEERNIRDHVGKWDAAVNSVVAA
jgi:hypothetical protein